MTKLHLDFETRSKINLKKVGIDVYSHHETTEILMLAYAFDDQPVKIWLPHSESLPQDVKNALTDPDCVKYAWNVGFEYNIIEQKLGIPLGISQWRDPMAHARYLGLPGSLEDAGEILGLSVEHAKSKEGKKLIKLFSSPVKATKKKPERWNDWESHPEEWKLFCDYCMQDVTAERELCNRLDARSPFPIDEQKIWVIDQHINQRGIPIDLDYVAKALKIVENERGLILCEMEGITGCENANSPKQLKEWLANKGYTHTSISKEFVAAAIKAEEVSPDAYKVLELKQMLGGIAFKKLPVIQQWTRDNRLRNALTYYAAHTGRWASRGVQFHNLLRPTKRVNDAYDKIVEAILTGGPFPENIPIIESVSGALRAAVRASEGHKLYVCDYSSIENRVLAWLAECPGMLDVFKKGLDPYKAFAVKLYNKLYEDITKEERNFCKSPVLGCGFGMGAFRLIAYAANLGQEISEEQANTLVKTWRKTYPEVVEYWDEVGLTAIKAVVNRQHLQLGPIRFDGRNPDMLKITLPSGRSLFYDRPEKGVGKFGKPVLTYLNEGQREEARGSFLVENIVQAVARDLLVNGMHGVIELGFDLVLHVHDELVAEVPTDSPLTFKMFEEAMIKNPLWGLDLPLKAEGYEGQYYKKG